MSSLLNFGMPSSKKEKHYANSRARRHSDVVISHSSKKPKKEKDADTESLSSSTPSSADTVVVPPTTTPSPKKCPLRFLLAGMIEPDDDGKKPGCPLRRVQLWHTIPLCLLAIINLLLVIIALLGLAGYRIALGVQGLLVGFFKSDLVDGNPYAESVVDSDDGATLVTEKQET